ncbi:sigma-70 family RNA polymerase sigma factor [Anaerobacillus alkaliphilus]|uniref:RNA polymerase sigma factor n=1 Tax=Anaerobacillus alkaliphilus TaxID=1548597 RepID=A0A4Q0VMY4_9BACI|nr:sigma-70 family RNA polymerase sigma factor [Anaerobacillus alkaliphilus]RXI96493.1 sigma-70 family RNA polymerase sigma factor [Anaerobacillus alkaliphilus]
MSNWRTLEDLYSLYYKEIFRYLLQRTRNRDLALDLAQDTFLKAFHGLASFKGNSSVKTWLYTIAHNTFINWYRRETRYSSYPIEEIQPLEQDIYRLPEDAVTQKAEQEQLLKAILSLKDDYQHVIILREFQELSYEEMTDILDWKLSKVKTNLHRAKLELRKHLQRTEVDTNEM